MIDFPASPTVGQQFTAAGVTWAWDGAKWTASGLSGGPFLPLAGGTLTGDLTINESSITRLWLNSPSNGFGNFVYGQKGGLNRWFAAFGDGTAESGGNAGSNFYLGCADDSGAGLWTPISINRASGQVTIPNLNAPQAIGDNRIINGDMRIDQRNNGASGTAAGYTIDRWLYSASQANKGTWIRGVGGTGAIGSLGFPYYFNFASSSAYAALATDSFGLTQVIEADMVSDLAMGLSNAQPCTVSFWANSSLTGTFSGSLCSAGPPYRSYPFTYSLAANTWTKIAVTIPGDTVAGQWQRGGNGVGLYLRFDLGCGANFRSTAGSWQDGNFLGVTGTVSVVAINGASFNVTGVKLEIGSTATPFNRQSPAKSLADCQRYYQSYTALSGAGYTAGTYVVQHGYTIAQTMRATPTVTPTWGTNTQITPAIQGITQSSFVVGGTTAATGQWGFNLSGLMLSAEL